MCVTWVPEGLRLTDRSHYYFYLPCHVKIRTRLSSLLYIGTHNSHSISVRMCAYLGRSDPIKVA